MARICMRKAINKDDVVALKSCLSHLPVGTDESCSDMNGALRQAAGFGKTECLRILLDHGAEINAAGITSQGSQRSHLIMSGRTALQEACAYGAGLDMIDLLVCRGLRSS